MDWDDYGPTIEDQIRSDDELSPTQKKLLIQKSKIESYRAGLTFVLLILLLAAIGVIVRGWISAVIDVAIFWGFAITHTVLEDKKSKVEAALAEEYENQKKSKSRGKKRV
jgi:hypothetical protein